MTWRSTSHGRRVNGCRGRSGSIRMLKVSLVTQGVGGRSDHALMAAKVRAITGAAAGRA